MTAPIDPRHRRRAYRPARPDDGRLRARAPPIPGTMREDVGGGTFNALRTAVQRGAAGALMSVRGGDAAGERGGAGDRRRPASRDLSAIFLDRATPSYTALLDARRRRDRGARRHGALRDRLRQAAAARLDARRRSRRPTRCSATPTCRPPRCSGSRRCAPGKPLFAIAISPAKAVRLAGILPALACLFLNRREAAALTGLDAGAPPAEHRRPAARRWGSARGASPQGDRAGDRLRRAARPRRSRRQRRADRRRHRRRRRAGRRDGRGAACAAGRSREAVRDGMAAALLAVESADRRAADLRSRHLRRRWPLCRSRSRCIRTPKPENAHVA